MVATINHKSASLTLRPVEYTTVWLSNFSADSVGDADEIMTALLKNADLVGITLQLDARNSRHPKDSTGEVIVFYEEYGFHRVEELGRYLMERPPGGSQEKQVL